MDWYYAIDGKQQGPVDEATLQGLARGGKLRPGDYVWNATMGSQWARASTVPGLFGGPGSAPIPPVPLAFVSQTPNRDLMASARATLVGNWGTAIGIVIVYMLLAMLSSSIPLLPLLITGAFSLGLSIVFLGIARSQTPLFSQLFDGFKQFGTSLGAALLMSIFILLWTLLLIVPGIIASFAYSMTYFIMADEPGIGPLEAIRRSKQMMRGNKWKYFCLQLRFLGWMLLCLLTCGIGLLWLFPYIMTSQARFYEDLRQGQRNA